MTERQKRPSSVRVLICEIRAICDNLFMMRFDLLRDHTRRNQMTNRLCELVGQIAERRLRRQTAAYVLRELQELKDLLREGLLGSTMPLWAAVRRIQSRVARVVT